tara:strand:+ start:97 stop:372 length:276 start_codon:yes stop_codon:yes gene_type:complete
MKIFHIICLVLFLSLQNSLFFSNNSIFTYFDLKNTHDSHTKKISELIRRNGHLSLEIEKVTSDKDFLEGYARENYGYIKKNEIFFQIIKDE